MYVRVMVGVESGPVVDTDMLEGLDASGVCAAAEAAQAALVAAEAELFVLAAHWADLHAGPMLNSGHRASGRLLPGTERSLRIGADGTPLVGEFAAAEYGALRAMGHVAARHLIADALNVRHRHPRLWRAVTAGRVRVWQARKTAQLCADAGLDHAQTLLVDAQTSDYAGTLPWARFETLVQAKIIETDPTAAEERRRAAAMRRFVATGQSNQYGLKTLIARATAGDVIFLVAMLDRIAHILTLHGDTDPIEVRRSKALGILATPARALHLLQTTSGNDDNADTAAPVQGDDTPDSAEVREDPEVVGEADVHPSQNDADDPAQPQPQRCPTCAGTGHGAGQVTGDPTPFTRPGRVDPRRLLPNATLYIHIAADMLHGGTGVARCEGVGPITRAQVIEFLGHTAVRVVPVIDLAGQEPVDGYEVPDKMAEALHLRNPACVSPWSTNLSRNKDSDHNQPYRPPAHGGPPGQTRPDNLARLARFPHRLKTHGGWRLEQPAPGTWEWRTPHGYHYRVDHNGTHPLGRHHRREQPEPSSDPRHERRHERRPPDRHRASPHHRVTDSTMETHALLIGLHALGLDLQSVPPC